MRGKVAGEGVREPRPILSVQLFFLKAIGFSPYKL